MNRIIVVCGRQYAGKSTFAAVLGGGTGLPVFEIGAFVFAEAEACGLAPHVFADEVFRHNRFERFVEDAIAAIPDGVASAIFVGPRTARELELLRANAEQSLCIGLVTSYEERHRRWLDGVPRKPHVATNEIWQAREQFEDRWNIDEALATCDLRIDGVTYGSGR